MYAVAEQASAVRDQRLREAAAASIRREARATRAPAWSRFRLRPLRVAVTVRRLAH